MKLLLLYDYPPPPAGLPTQGDLLFRGLHQIGVEARAAHLDSALEKEWYYRWFRPDAVIGVGYWGMTPQLVLHPQRHGMLPVPWLVADGYVANYRDALDSLPLVLVTSNWVKETYIRDGLSGRNIEVLPVGCDTDTFVPRGRDEPEVAAVRQALGIRPDHLMILTVGGDAASKGGREVMYALAALGRRAPEWRYVCKVWPQERTAVQNQLDVDLARELGIADRVVFPTCRISRNLMPYLLAACDIYAGPSRLEGFGMTQVEANACAKPVIGIRAMAMLETLVHGETAFLAGVAEEVRISGIVLGPESGFEVGHHIVLDPPRVSDYRADANDIAAYLDRLMGDPELRRTMGATGRARAVECFDYRLVARKLTGILSQRLGIE